MTKKTYKQPSVKVVHLEATAILANSGEPQSLGLYEDVGNYAEYEQPHFPSDIWGSQW